MTICFALGLLVNTTSITVIVMYVNMIACPRASTPFSLYKNRYHLNLIEFPLNLTFIISIEIGHVKVQCMNKTTFFLLLSQPLAVVVITKLQNAQKRASMREAFHRIYIQWLLPNQLFPFPIRYALQSCMNHLTLSSASTLVSKCTIYNYVCLQFAIAVYLNSQSCTSHFVMLTSEIRNSITKQAGEKTITLSMMSCLFTDNKYYAQQWQYYGDNH